jgi:hypothetical protein
MEVALKPLTKKQRAELHGYVAWGTTLFQAVLFLAALTAVGWLLWCVQGRLTEEGSPYSHDLWWIVPVAALAVGLYVRAGRWTGGRSLRKKIRAVEAPDSKIFFGINPAGDRLQPSLKRPPFSWEEAKSLGALEGNYRVLDVDFESIKRAATAVLVLFLLSGCRESSRISAVARLDPPLTTEMLTVTIQDDSRGWTWRGSDFQSSLDLPTPTTRERETGTRGEIEISFRLQMSGDTVSEGRVKLPLRSDWRWGVQVVSATSDPGEACFGCTGSKAFPLAPEYRGPERDSVWLVWGGSSISGKAGQGGSGAAGQDVTPSAARGP